jgi:signal transduction histidine kinase
MRLVYWGEFLPLLIATYSTGRHLPRRLAVVGLALALGGFASLAAIFAELREPGDLLFDAALIIALWALGLFSASWAAHRERSLRAELDRALAEERGVQAERARIARELHDVIAHTITVIVVQAGAARLASDADPAVARKALREIEALGRGSLAELRLLLAVLRRDDVTDDGTEPQPTLATLHELCDRMRGLGLPVRLDDQRGDVALPLGLQLTAYRIVQESLTNVVKHAGSAPTRVRLDRQGPDADFVVEIINDAPTQRGEPVLPGAHRGLEGLAERVRALGGRFSCGERPDGGFLVRAELPMPEGLA